MIPLTILTKTLAEMVAKLIGTHGSFYGRAGRTLDGTARKFGATVEREAGRTCVVMSDGSTHSIRIDSNGMGWIEEDPERERERIAPPAATR